VVIEPSWDSSIVPTTRSLAEILMEAVKHGEEYPTHGADCICMDALVREVRVQVSRAMPPMAMDHEDWRENFKARSRASVILSRVWRSL
jgi:hypothetical protein